jgi:hypothetical protein
MPYSDPQSQSFLPDRARRPLHLFRNLDHRGPFFRMGFEVAYVLFGPRNPLSSFIILSFV